MPGTLVATEIDLYLILLINIQFLQDTLILLVQLQHHRNDVLSDVLIDREAKFSEEDDD